MRRNYDPVKVQTKQQRRQERTAAANLATAVINNSGTLWKVGNAAWRGAQRLIEERNQRVRHSQWTSQQPYRPPTAARPTTGQPRTTTQSRPPFSPHSRPTASGTSQRKPPSSSSRPRPGATDGQRKGPSPSFARAQNSGADSLRGSDVHSPVLLTSEEARNGVVKQISLQDPMSTWTKTLNVRFPPRLMDMQELRLKGAGIPGTRGAPAGDARITVFILSS